MKTGKIFVLYSEEDGSYTAYRSFEDALEKIKTYYIDYTPICIQIDPNTAFCTNVTVWSKSRFVDKVLKFEYEIYETEVANEGI